MGEIIFISGGARSGKSRLAVKLAKDSAGKIAFLATCDPGDSEMKKRVVLHKKARPKSWTTFEEPEEPAVLLKKIGSKFEVIIIDCLTLLVANLIQKGHREKAIKNKINRMLNIAGKINAAVIFVSNEVGLGIVPVNKLARNFRDLAGWINQMVAEKAGRVFFVVSGIPWRLK